MNPDGESISELFQKFKQSMRCLEREQKINRINMMEYQTFISSLKDNTNEDAKSKYNFYLTKRVGELEKMNK